MVAETLQSNMVNELLQDRKLSKIIKETLSSFLEENPKDKIGALTNFLDIAIKGLSEFANLLQQRPKKDEKLEIDKLTHVCIIELKKVESCIKMFSEINKLPIKNTDGLNEKVNNFLKEITDSKYDYSLKVKVTRDEVIRQISNITKQIELIQNKTYTNPPHCISNLVSYLKILYKVGNLTENEHAYRSSGMTYFPHVQNIEPKQNTQSSSNPSGKSPFSAPGGS